jgi:hypothetical protein
MINNIKTIGVYPLRVNITRTLLSLLLVRNIVENRKNICVLIIYRNIAIPLESYTFYTRSGELKTWVRIPPCRQDNSGYRIMVITPAFQVGDVGSTPVTRTMGWHVQRLR